MEIGLLEEMPAVGIAERRHAAEMDRAGKYEPGISESGIPSEVLERLLPGDDVVVLDEPVVAGS